MAGIVDNRLFILLLLLLLLLLLFVVWCFELK